MLSAFNIDLRQFSNLPFFLLFPFVFSSFIIQSQQSYTVTHSFSSFLSATIEFDDQEEENRARDHSFYQKYLLRTHSRTECTRIKAIASDVD